MATARRSLAQCWTDVGWVSDDVLKIGRNFQFEVPDDWEESRDGARYVFHGPACEELIISSSLVEGAESLADRRWAESQTLSNAMKTAAEAAVQDGLVNTLPLRREDAITNVSCWCFVSETPTRDTIFMGAVAASSGGVLFITLEAPWGPEPLSKFRTFLGSLRRPTN